MNLPPKVAVPPDRRAAPSSTAGPALPSAASHPDHAEFYPYHDSSQLSALSFNMELPPPTGRHKHPVWSTPKPILTALFILHLPDGRHRIATAHDTLELETMDLERAAMHLGMKASHQLNK